MEAGRHMTLTTLLTTKLLTPRTPQTQHSTAPVFSLYSRGLLEVCFFTFLTGVVAVRRMAGQRLAGAAWPTDKSPGCWIYADSMLWRLRCSEAENPLAPATIVILWGEQVVTQLPGTRAFNLLTVMVCFCFSFTTRQLWPSKPWLLSILMIGFIRWCNQCAVSLKAQGQSESGWPGHADLRAVRLWGKTMELLAESGTDLNPGPIRMA